MSIRNKVFIVGGTGFLGYHTILEFLNNGWEATAVGLPSALPESSFPPGINLILRDIIAIPDEELLDLLGDHQAFVFAAGMDDRVIPKKPAYPKFHRANVEVPVHLLMLAKQAGIKNAVVFGSYFAHFHRLWPNLKLADRHPYIRSRVAKENAVTSIPGLNVSVLELPYIFGDAFGKRSLWYPLVQYLRAMPFILCMHGGTACISVKTVGKAAYSVIKRGEGNTFYPICQENLTWSQLLTRLALAEGRRIKVVAFPTWIIKLGMHIIFLFLKSQGKESGLNPLFFSDMQCAQTFLDSEFACKTLGYQLDDLDESFKATMDSCRRNIARGIKF